MYDSLINFSDVTDFLRGGVSALDEELTLLEQAFHKENLPIIKPETARLLKVICSIRQPKNILEIGTCVGFSSVLMARTCSDAKVTTIDRYKYMVKRAKENFQEFDRSNQITLIEGQARDVLPKLQKNSYDLVFLDAAKGQYPRFLPYCIDLLVSGGVLVADNILFDGLVANSSRCARRDTTIVKRLREFLCTLKEDIRFDVSVIPIGDGVCIAVKK